MTFLSAAILFAYLSDWFGLTIRPPAILIASCGAAAAVLVSIRRHSPVDRSALVAFVAIVAGAFGWLLWRARPELLPTGSGPDLVHHLALIDYIERNWQLVHDWRLSEYLGEMVDYTPGFHLLAALVGAWLPRVDGLHAVYPVVAFTVALKAGIVFLIAWRLVPADTPRVAFAVAAVLVLLAPRVYSIGSFTEQSYLAQVVSELFAVAAWWMLVVWDERPSLAAMRLFGVFAVATFLVWPVWIGPLAIVVAVTALLHGERPLAERARHVLPAAAGVGVIAAMHGARHVGGFRMAGTGGFVITPTVAAVGWPFLAASALAVAAAAFKQRTRIVALLAAAIAVQAIALIYAARSSGAANPYLATKMFYLAIYPMAIAVALLLAVVWRAVAARVVRLNTPATAWALVALVFVVSARPIVGAPRPKPVVTEPVLQAAEWTRQHVARECVDYLTQDGYTAYWLHLAVFGNPRASGRATDDDTFEPKKAIVRWILPGGLPYAITDDLTALPRDIRDHVDVAARFGRAAVVKRRGAVRSPCP